MAGALGFCTQPPGTEDPPEKSSKKRVQLGGLVGGLVGGRVVGETVGLAVGLAVGLVVGGMLTGGGLGGGTGPGVATIPVAQPEAAHRPASMQACRMGGAYEQDPEMRGEQPPELAIANIDASVICPA